MRKLPRHSTLLGHPFCLPCDLLPVVECAFLAGARAVAARVPRQRGGAPCACRRAMRRRASAVRKAEGAAVAAQRRSTGRAGASKAGRGLRRITASLPLSSTSAPLLPQLMPRTISAYLLTAMPHASAAPPGCRGELHCKAAASLELCPSPFPSWWHYRAGSGVARGWAGKTIAGTRHSWLPVRDPESLEPVWGTPAAGDETRRGGAGAARGPIQPPRREGGKQEGRSIVVAMPREAACATRRAAALAEHQRCTDV